jgi:virginiamycin B lyase
MGESLVSVEGQALRHGPPAGPPVTVFGRIVEFVLPPPAGGGFSLFPQQITVGRDNDLWFRVAGAQLGHMSRNGRQITLVSIPSSGSGIARGSDGNIWFGTAAGIGRLAHSGAVAEFALPDIGSPQDVVAGPDGNLWALGFDHVARITTAGAVTSFPIPTPLFSSGHLAAGPDDNVWFTNAGAALLARVTPGGVITEFPVGPGGSLFGIAGDHDQAIWFTRQGGEPGQNSIGRITTSGHVSTVLQLPDSTTTLPDPPSGMPMVITAGRDDNMYYTTYFEQPRNYIGRVTPSGLLTKFDIPTGGAASFGITADRAGDIWFTENFNNQIGRLDARR